MTENVLTVTLNHKTYKLFLFVICDKVVFSNVSCTLTIMLLHVCIFQVERPTVIPGLDGKTVDQIECGEFHTLLLLNTGELYSCGNNENGQLGHNKRTTRPGNLFALCYHHDPMVTI